MKKEELTIVICCAGMGTRLGIGTTKSLVHIDGKPLIYHLLNELISYDDIRIVVGYQAEKLISVVNKLRTDVMYVFNYDYETTKVGYSLSKALQGARKYIIVIDGDLLFNGQDLKKMLEYDDEVVGVSTINSDTPIYAKVHNGYVVDLNLNSGNKEWGCIAKVLSSKLESADRNVYEILNPMLPIKAFPIRVRGIDTPDDYDRMLCWYNNNCEE